MSENRFEELVKQADQLLVNSDFSEALNCYLEADKVNPNNPIVVRNIGNVYFKLNQFEGGIRENIRYALILQNSGRPEESEKIYKELLEFNEANPKLSFADKKILNNAPELANLIGNYIGVIAVNLALIYFQNKDFSAASAVCKKALEKRPSDFDIHSMLGRIYNEEGKIKEAVGEFQEVIRTSPEKASFGYESIGDIFSKDPKKKNEAVTNYNNAAALYKKEDYIEKEAEVYNKILAIDPQNAKALSALGDVLIKLDRKNEALEALNNLIELYESEGMLDKVILVYEKIHEFDDNNEAGEKLINIYKEILDKDPSNLSAGNKLIAHFINMGRVDDAIPVFINLANGYLERNLIDDGINISNKVIEIAPDNPYAHRMLGNLYLKKGGKDEALSAYVKAFEIFRKNGDEKEASAISEILNKNFPDQSVIHYQLAVSFFEKNQMEKSEEEVLAALLNNPADVLSLKLYMNILQQQNKNEDLIGVYQKILQLCPEEVLIREKLIDLYLNYGRIDDAVKESKYLGDVLCENKDYKTSEKIFRNILSFFPNDLDVRERIAYLLFHRNQTHKAKRELLSILDYDLKNDNFIHAIDICRKMIKIDPQDFNAYCVMGKLALRGGMIKEALSCYMFLADLYLLNKMHYKAIEIILEILKISAKQTRYRSELINILLLENKTEAAKEHYKILIKDLIEEQNTAKAMEAARKLIDLSRDNFSLRKELSIIFIKNDFVEEGIKILSEFLEFIESKSDYTGAIEVIDPVLALLFNRGHFNHFWNLRKKKATWYDALGDHNAGANEKFEIITGMLKQNFTVDAEKEISGFILYAKDKEAARYFIKLLDFAKDLYDGNLFSILTVLLKPLGEYYREIKDYEKVLFITDMLIKSYGKINNKEEALNCYKKKIEIYYLLNDADNLVVSLFEVIRLLIGMNKNEEINEFYQRIIKIKDSPDVKIKMANIYFEIKNYEKTKELMEEIEENIKNDADSLIKLALSYIKLDIYDKAIARIKALASLGRLSEVIKEYKAGLKEKFNPFNQNIVLAKFYKDIGFCEDALFALFAADAIEYNFEVKKLIAAYLKECGFIDTAVKHYKNILEISLTEEEFLEVKYEIAGLYEAAGRLKEAIENYQDALAINIKYKDVAQKLKQLNEKMRGQA